MTKLLFGLAFGPRATAFLDRMPPGKIRAQITKKAKTLILDSCPPGCKKLIGIKEGDEDVWRIRSGNYRILYVVRTVPHNIVMIINIDHRKDVYR